MLRYKELFHSMWGSIPLHFLPRQLPPTSVAAHQTKDSPTKPVLSQSIEKRYKQPNNHNFMDAKNATFFVIPKPHYFQFYK